MMVPKFRGWDRKNHVMYDFMMMCFNVNLKNVLYRNNLTDFDVDMYTGLKDSNGKEIYEGDVLEYYYETHGQTFYDPDTLGAVGGEPGIETTVIGKVAIWPSTGVVLTRIKAEYPEDFDSSNLDVPKVLHVNKRFTIIGNIHENPELFEAQHG